MTKPKLEFGLKVLWDRDLVIATIEREHEGIRRLREEIAHKAQGSTYFARNQLSRLLETAIEEAGNRYVREIHETLRPAAGASRPRNLVGDRMILNSAFLVDPASEAAFAERLNEIARRYQELLTFKLTGPAASVPLVSAALDHTEARG